MEMHDDHPDYFEFVLKFMYTEMYDTDVIENMAKGDKTKRMEIPMGIHEIADKYDVTRLLKPVTDDVLLTLKAAADLDRCDMLQTVITAHYEHIPRANTSMGNMLVSFLLGCNFMESGFFEVLLQSYPMFAADVALGLFRGGMLTKLNSIHKYERKQCGCGFAYYRAATDPQNSHFCRRCNRWL